MYKCVIKNSICQFDTKSILVNMDFKNVNPLNVRVNLFSGNLLPLIPGDRRFSILWKLYNVLMWSIQIAQVIMLIAGATVVSWEKFLTDGLLSLVVVVEIFFAVMQIYLRRNLVDQLIQKLNNILYVADETMKNLVTTTFKPMETPLKFYLVGGSLSVFIWYCVPLLLVFEKVTFVYEDYRMPAVFSKQPFSTDVFVIGSVFNVICNINLYLKKVGVDFYIIHLVLIIMVQYQYIAVRLAAIFRERKIQNKMNAFRIQGDHHEVDQQMKREIKALCKHHIEVVQMSSMLKKLLSLNFSLIYLNSVLRFCFIGVMMSTISSLTFLESILISVFACGSIVQFYLLCFCVQRLLDASMELTNEAFHEQWYQFGPSVKSTFMLMMLGSKLECKISMCDKYNLSLPSFMEILSQSYTIALLFLKIN